MSTPKNILGNNLTLNLFADCIMHRERDQWLSYAVSQHVYVWWVKMNVIILSGDLDNCDGNYHEWSLYFKVHAFII